jgi:Ca2+-binding EF-hand superfamily protein
LDLQTVFDKYDKSKDHSLSSKEFKEMMKEIDSTLSDEEILFLFNKFDDDENGTI